MNSLWKENKKNCKILLKKIKTRKINDALKEGILCWFNVWEGLNMGLV